jgi:orotate phosphoribosyltransferase-like protein
MKNLILSICFLFAAAVANAQFAGISTAMDKGDAGALSQFFDAKIEITTPNQDGIFDKEQAKGIIQNFFATNKPNSFSIVHQGASKGKASIYAIGELSASGKKFRVFIYINETAGKTMIQQIEIETEG